MTWCLSRTHNPRVASVWCLRCMSLCRRGQGGTALAPELWTRRTLSRPLRTSPLCRLALALIPGCFFSDFGCFVSSFFRFPRQIYSNREVEEAMTKIRDVLSDDKRDWELRVAAVSES